MRPTGALVALRSSFRKLWKRDVLALVEKLCERLVAELTRVHHILYGALEVKMRPIWLNHLHNQVIVLAVDVEEQFFLLEGLWVMIGSCGPIATPLIFVRL